MALGIGVFMPALQVPVFGGISFREIRGFQGVFSVEAGVILCLALVALTLSLADRGPWLALPALGALAAAAEVAVWAYLRLGQAKEAARGKDGGLFGALERGMLDSMSPGVAWLVLGVGVFFLLAGAAASGSRQGRPRRVY
jgi:hypothetical protein